MGRVLFATWCLTSGLILHIVQLIEVRVICALELLRKLILINGSNLISLCIILCLILELGLLLFHCFVDDSLLQHLTESLVEWLQSEVVRRI